MRWSAQSRCVSDQQATTKIILDDTEDLEKILHTLDVDEWRYEACI